MPGGVLNPKFISREGFKCASKEKRSVQPSKEVLNPKAKQKKSVPSSKEVLNPKAKQEKRSVQSSKEVLNLKENKKSFKIFSKQQKMAERTIVETGRFRPFCKILWIVVFHYSLKKIIAFKSCYVTKTMTSLICLLVHMHVYVKGQIYEENWGQIFKYIY